jgi:hypothetical protein
MARTATGIVDGGGTGVISAGPTYPQSPSANLSILLGCNTSTPSTVLYQATLTAVKVGNFTGAAVKGKPAHRLIHNHFAGPRAGLPAPHPASTKTGH